MKKLYTSPETTIVELNLVGSVLDKDIGIAGGSKNAGWGDAAKQNSNFDFYNEEFEDEETQNRSYNLWD